MSSTTPDHSPTRQPLPLRDTSEVYGKVSRGLHWAMAALILWQFLSMGLKNLLGRDAIPSFFVGSHQPVGTILFLLILIRFVWSISNSGNRPDHGTGPLAVAAKAGHGILYLLMLLVPIFALIRAYGSDKVFAPFGFEIFPAQTPVIEWTKTLADALHGEMAWVLGVLILGHVVMVGVHQAMWRDGTLNKMAGPHRR